MLTSVFNVFVHYNVVEGRTYKDTLFFLDRYLIPYYNLYHIKHIEIVGNIIKDFLYSFKVPISKKMFIFIICII